MKREKLFLHYFGSGFECLWAGGQAPASRLFADTGDRMACAQQLKDLLEEKHVSAGEAVLTVSTSRVSSRLSRLPSVDAQEIRRMVGLQAVRELPQTQDEIIAGYEIVDASGDGFSCVHIQFAHAQALKEALEFCERAEIAPQALYLNIYGLAGLLKRSPAQSHGEVLCVNLDPAGVDIAVLNKGRIWLNRYFAGMCAEPGWQQALFAACMDTQSLYLSQSGLGPVKRLLVSGDAVLCGQAKEFLSEKMVIPVELVAPAPGEPASCLGGFTVELPPESISLLPEQFRKMHARRHRQERYGHSLLIAGCALVFLAGALYKHVLNKQSYREELYARAEELSQEAASLDGMFNQLQMFRQSQAQYGDLFAFFAAIHRAAVAGMNIGQIDYNAKAGERFSLTGTANAIDTVLAYSANLKRLKEFSSYEIKVDYAGSKSGQETDKVQFKIIFIKP